MSRYAEGTKVSSADSRAEIERTLTRYGADGFMYGWEGRQALVAFRIGGRQVRFILTMPDPKADEFCSYMRGSVRFDREPHIATEKWEQGCRQRWRALALVIKAKLEAVESEISCLEDEFMANIVMPDGRTVGDTVRPSIELAYQTGTMQPMLPDYTGGQS